MQKSPRRTQTMYIWTLNKISRIRTACLYDSTSEAEKTIRCEEMTITLF